MTLVRYDERLSHEGSVPRRNQSQRIGHKAENIVRGQIDDHDCWLARSQDHDFGVDLEAELALPDNQEEQHLGGKLIKIQIKGTRSWSNKEKHTTIVLKRSYLHYINQFRLPVILVAVNVTRGDACYIWLQDWILRNENVLAAGRPSSRVSVKVPLARSLNSGLDSALKEIARGDHATAIILALRELAVAATTTGNNVVFERILDILVEIDEPSRTWIVQKTIDPLIGMGPHVGLWQTQRLLPQLFALVDRLGNNLTAAQIDRLVRRDDSYSRTSIYALGRFYDRWPDHARSLGLPAMFRAAKLEPVAWYCALREHYPSLSSLELFDALVFSRLPHTQFGALKLPSTPEFATEAIQRWPNRGDWFYLERIVWAEPEPVEPDESTPKSLSGEFIRDCIVFST